MSAGRDPINAKKYVQRSRMFEGSEAKARKALAAFETEIAEKGHGTSTNASFGLLLDRWIEVSKGQWTEGTLEANEGQVRRYIKPALGAVSVRRLTTEDFDRFYAGLRSKGLRKRKLSEATVLRVHANCNAAFNCAVAWGWVARNPVAHVMSKPTQQNSFKSSRDLPLVEIVTELFDAAAERDPEWGRLLFAKIGIGARRGEMAGLQLRAVDVESGTVSIERQIVQPKHNSHLSLKDVKRGNRRTFQLDGPTLSVLRAQIDCITERAERNDIKLKPEAFLWSDELDNSIPWKPDRMTQRFTRLCKPKPAQGFAGLPLRLHDLRHFNGTMLNDAGVDLATIAHRLGHSRLSTTSNFYIERVTASDKKAARLLGKRLK